MASRCLEFLEAYLQVKQPVLTFGKNARFLAGGSILDLAVTTQVALFPTHRDEEQRL